MIEKSAGAVIFRRKNNKIYYLLLRHRLGHWSFPRGHIKKGEKLKKTVKREVKEETDIGKIKFIGGFKEEISYFLKNKRKDIFKIVTYLLAKTNREIVKISAEHTNYQWLTYQMALKKLTFKNDREILKKANCFLKVLKF